MKSTKALKPSLLIALLCWGMLFLTAAPAQSDKEMRWTTSACPDFLFIFNLNYDGKGNISNIRCAVKPPYTSLSPEFDIPITPNESAPILWEVDVDGKRQRIIEGSMRVFLNSAGEGGRKDNMFMVGNFYYYCNKSFNISERFHFEGALFQFPSKK